MKRKFFYFFAALGLSSAATAQRVDASIDPQIDPQVRTFLKDLNAAGKGKTPLYELPGSGPGDATRPHFPGSR